MQKIIDCHVHRLDDSQVDWARELGYYKICLMDWRPKVLAERFARHPDFVIPLGWVPTDRGIDAALAAVEEFRRMGCRGFKICCAGAPYDDEQFYPIWEKAQEYRMPCYFHTGWLDQRIATEVYPTARRLLVHWYDVMTLDRIALDFPRLNLVAFHMGNTRPADCAVLMRNHKNVYADTCTRLDEFTWASIGGRENGYPVLGKTVVGTDGMGTRERHRSAMERLGKFLELAGASEALRQRVYYKTALRILGMDEELKKTFVARKVKPAVLDPAKALSGALKLKPMTDFVDRRGEPAGAGTKAWLGYDAQSLHMTFACRDRHAKKLAVTRDGPVGDIWQDDCIEIFLSPTRDEDYYHIAVNSIGRAFIQRRRGEVSEFRGEVKTKTGPDGWAVGMAIPFSLLGGAPASGSKWGLNVCRNKTTPPRGVVTWMEIASTFHDPAAFGYLAFE